MTPELLFDTHCHLYNNRYEQDRDEVLNECQQNMAGWINIGADLMTSISCKELTLKFPDKSRFTAGIHPHDTEEAKDEDLLEIENLLKEPLCVAAGEMGLDYFYKHSQPERQKELFKAQLLLAKNHGLPTVIHVRDAFDDFFEVIDSVGYYKGVVHCFTGGLKEGKAVTERGLMVSFGGMLTFSNTQDIQNAARELPMQSILLETDSPYLAPIPHRGRRNHPRYVEFAGLKLAELKAMDPKMVFSQALQNAKDLFGLEFLNP